MTCSRAACPLSAPSMRRFIDGKIDSGMLRKWLAYIHPARKCKARI
jgi:hypothetical protein